MKAMKNKYIVRSRISEKNFREILWYFSSDIEAIRIAEFTNISRKTINKITKNIRILMAGGCEKISKFSGEVQVVNSPRSFALRLMKATFTLLRSLLFKTSHSVAIRILILLKILHKLISKI